MIHIHARDQYAFLRSIGFDQIDDVEYVTHGQNDHCLVWKGFRGRDDGGHWYEIVRFADFTIAWFRNGELHRDNDLPAIVCINSHQEWWIDDKIHRINRPAVINVDGSKEWWINNERYRANDIPIHHICI